MKKLLGLLLVPFLLYSCDIIDFGKSESGYLDYLPKKTQEGANTFGCYINGELAATRGYFQEEGTGSALLGGRYEYVNGFWGIYGFNNVDTIMRFDIQLKQASLIMRYPSLHRGIYECEVNIWFRGDSGISGSAIVTVDMTKFDRSNHIISGEFNALDIPLYNYKDSAVHLRKCRFDIKYGTNF